MAYKAFFDRYRSFGVEIEVIGRSRLTIRNALLDAQIPCMVIDQTNELLTSWRVSKDRSIQGNNPAEVVSPALYGVEGLLEVAMVMDILQHIGCQVNATCGFHVHWNCADFTGKNLLSLLRLYAKFEPVIDYLVSPSRRNNSNTYCQSMVKGEDLSWVFHLDPSEKLRAKEVVKNFDRTYTKRYSTVYPPYESSIPSERRHSRYHKVNISAYSRYGTVEFRQHQGTVSSQKALNWILFTQQFVNKAKYSAVSRNSSAKVSLGEMLRILGITQSEDGEVKELRKWLKERHTYFKKGAGEDETD